MKNCKIFIIAGGFYFFGEEVNAPEGYVALKNCSMFGGFGGGKGLPGVARGDKDSTVTLDKFKEEDVHTFPSTSCYGILSSIDLYSFKGTTIR
jgi:hypothetical protein